MAAVYLKIQNGVQNVTFFDQMMIILPMPVIICMFRGRS